MNATRDSAGFLKEAFDRKAKTNPRFSLRAFARLLGISPGGLSQVLSRRKRLSMDRAHELARRLQLTAAERDLFLTLVEIESSSSEARKSELLERVSRMSGGAHNLSVDQFRLLSSWSGFAVFEMITVVDPNASNQAIARRLGISIGEVDAALERLERLELIEKCAGGPRFKRVEDTYLAVSPQSQEAFRKYYVELFERAERSLASQTPDERVSGAQVFAFDPSQLDEVRKLTNQYLDALNALSLQGKKRTEVYQALTHVFRLTEIDESKTKKRKKS